MWARVQRRLRVQLADLADAMTRASVPQTHDAVCAALSSWVAHRPTYLLGSFGSIAS